MFGIGTNTEGTNRGAIRGTQMEIACECWFTSKGNTMPLMLKFQDDEGIIQTIHDIQVNYSEEKNYAGISSIEYDCTIAYYEKKHLVKLIFFKEECRWIMCS